MGAQLSWLLMFRAHRDLWERLVLAEARLAETERLNAELTHFLAQARSEPAEAPPAAALEALFSDFQEHALSEVPFPEGKIPEEAFLTPPYHDNA